MIHKTWFIWKDINSLDFGIIINKLPPVIKAERNINKIEVLGRNGFLTEDYGTYKGYAKSVECTIRNLEYIDNLCSWLNGFGNVIFSNEPDKIYRANIVNQIPIEKIARNWRKFIIQFECQPFKYLESELLIINKPISIYNEGTFESQPYMKIHGSGDISLNINDEVIKLKNINNYIELDSEIMECFKDNINCNNYMSGEFPIFKVGENRISWTGNVSKIEITPNWRCL